MKKNDLVLLGHGSGGRMSERLIADVIAPALNGGEVAIELDDAAPVTAPSGQLFMTTDSFVVDPIFFPGGDIGELAVNGTVNDLSMRGALPVAISAGLILEEGFPIKDLTAIAASMGRAARKAKVAIVCGDTKVVSRGSADKIFINTSGVGVRPEGVAEVGANRARPGDSVIISGTVGDHGVAVSLCRDQLPFPAPIKSDTQALCHLVGALLMANLDLHVMRDPTRGGLATTLVEIAETSGVAITLDERTIPVAPAVAAACETLGLDPLMVANEGKMIVIVPSKEADRTLAIMRARPEGKDAAIIGEVAEGAAGKVTLRSLVGGERMVTRLEGELLPRIC